MHHSQHQPPADRVRPDVASTAAKRPKIVEILRADRLCSDHAIAGRVLVDDSVVRRVRAALEASGEIEPAPIRRDTLGRRVLARHPWGV